MYAVGTKVKWIDLADRWDIPRSVDLTETAVIESVAGFGAIGKYGLRYPEQGNLWWAREDDIAPVDVNADDIPTAFPSPPDALGDVTEAIGKVLENLKWWAENNALPLADTVDEQAVLMGRGIDADGKPHVGFRVWPYAWGRQGAGKDYLGRVMRYKKSLLEGAPEPSETPTPFEYANQADAEAVIHTLRTTLAAAQQAHQDDIDTIGDSLIQLAKDRDWCSEYDDGIRNLNDNLNRKLRDRMNSYTVTWTETFTTTVYRSQTVDAMGSLDALEQVKENCAVTVLSVTGDELDTTVNIESECVDSGADWDTVKN